MKAKFLIPLTTIAAFILISGTVDLEHLFNYSNQGNPYSLATSWENPITDETATLGRVLFYDKNLSLNQTVACASCHQQEHGFGDPEVQSTGHNGELTERHSMRLVNLNYRTTGLMWEGNIATAEDQALVPISDHVEMGFSGENGNPGIDALVDRLGHIPYYQTLFLNAYNSSEISENRIRLAIAQFVKSLQSFDSKYDQAILNGGSPWGGQMPGYTEQELFGLQVYFEGGENYHLPCAYCHGETSFDIQESDGNNGVISTNSATEEYDFDVISSPSLRNLSNSDGLEIGPFMHDGSMETLMDCIEHYENISSEEQAENPNLNWLLTDDFLLGPEASFSIAEKEALVAFLKTLSGNEIYTAEKWSDPFDENGNITILNGPDNIPDFSAINVNVFPNPATEYINVDGLIGGEYNLTIVDQKGAIAMSTLIQNNQRIDVSSLPNGYYILTFQDPQNRTRNSRSLVIN